MDWFRIRQNGVIVGFFADETIAMQVVRLLRQAYPRDQWDYERTKLPVQPQAAK